MRQLKFYIDRWMSSEAALAEHSVALDALADDVSGKTIALVGNARSLLQAKHGKRIEEADIVIRINSAPTSNPESHGRRTDWHALAIRNSRELKRRVTPKRVLWMSHKRRRLDWGTAAAEGFYLFPLKDFHSLSRELGARPSTGVLLVDLLRRLPADRIELFGFDFFASLSMTGSRTSAQVPHDFEAERIWVEHLMENDRRFNLVV